MYQCCSTKAPLVDAKVHFVGTSRCVSSGSRSGIKGASWLSPRARLNPAHNAAANSKARALPSVCPEVWTKVCATAAALAPPWATQQRTNSDSQGRDARAGPHVDPPETPPENERLAVWHAAAHLAGIARR